MRFCSVFALALAASLAACVSLTEGTPVTPATVPVAADAPPPAPVLRRGVTEISEGTLRTLYIDRPMVGAKGYVVADWTQGEVRVEVKGFPPSDMGYEVFMFEIDIPTYMGKMF
ncbi:hypothetical protein IIA16_04800, partial [bacterium]|nr:hypothetical protein [bacterium]